MIKSIVEKTPEKMTATSASSKEGDKEETKPLTKKGLFLPPGTIPEEEHEVLDSVVATAPVIMVPSISRITTQSSLHQRTWDGKK